MLFPFQLFPKQIFPEHEEGQGLVEYALILVLVAIVVIAVMLLLGPTVRDTYNTVRCTLDTGQPVANVTGRLNGSNVEATVVTRQNIVVYLEGFSVPGPDNATAPVTSVSTSCNKDCTLSIAQNSSHFYYVSAAGLDPTKPYCRMKVNY